MQITEDGEHKDLVRESLWFISHVKVKVNADYHIFAL